MPPPLVLGHEFSGLVDKVGADVEGIEPGMRVTVEPSLVCGQCLNCTTGNYHACEKLKVIGCQSVGAYAEKIIVPAERVHILPDEVDFECGALVEPAAVGVHVVKRSGGVEGMNVAVLGAGPIGLMTARVAQLSGAKKVVITDIDDFRLSMARKLGLEETINVQTEAFKERVYEILGKNGPDIWFDCVGSGPTINQAINLARRRTTIVMVGVVPDNVVIEHMANIQEHELTVIGCLIYNWDDFQGAIKLFKQGKIKKEAVITHRFHFKDAPKAFEMIKARKEDCLKVMLCMD
jgi:L-iditol 2-dehydrogenase